MAALTPAPGNKRQSRRDSESILIIPKFVPTMQPTLVDDPPAGDDWLHEIKYDGYRTQLSIFSGEEGARGYSSLVVSRPDPPTRCELAHSPRWLRGNSFDDHRERIVSRPGD